MRTKRAIYLVPLILFLCLTARGAVPDWAGPGTRVKLQLKNDAVFYGKIVRRDDRMLYLEPFAAEAQPVGQLGIECTDVKSVERLSGKSVSRLLSEANAREFLEEAPPAGPEPSETEKAQKALTREERVLLGLVAEFPPERGWGEKRIKEIDRRWMIMDLQPTESEKRFKTFFPQWRRGVALKKKLEAEKEAEEKAEDERRKNLEKLLSEFPLEQGWSEKRFNALYEKLSAALSGLHKEELSFLDIYEDLKRGRALGKGKLNALRESLSEDENALVALVAQWPVEKGWTAERYDKLSRARRDAENVLTGKEKRFLKVFPDWKKGAAAVEGKAASRPEGASGGGASGRADGAR